MSRQATSPQVPSFKVPATEQPKLREAAERDQQMARVSELLHAQDAVLIAHYYTDPEVQALADATDGFIGDSLAMAQFGVAVQASTLVIAGVRFMGETAKILSPEKKVLMPTLQAECSLDLGCPETQFSQFCDEYPDHVVVVYANTSAAVKARADWVVTSSNALDIVSELDGQGKKIVWGPDRYLGEFIKKQTGADMVLWQGSCIVHEEFKAQALRDMKTQFPAAAVLVHPESPAAVVELADAVGSTSHLLQASQTMPNDTFIVATDRGIFYKMQQMSPQKTFIEAPTAGSSGTCRSCGHCPWMAMNNLDRLEQSLLDGSNEIDVEKSVRIAANVALQRMLDFQR